jgi:16S rRNA (guanine527-N7)-methyltransferase
MKPIELLKKGLLDLGFPHSEGQLNSFMTFLSELKKWNRAYNLTSLKTDKDIIIKHFLDSVLYLKVIPSDALKIADAGPGAGFPGLPMKIIHPGREITLIEASRKKSAFLRNIVRTLKLPNVIVLNKRLETLGDSYTKAFDAIVSRATFTTRGFIDQAFPYMKEQGCLVLSKGPKISEELDIGNKLNSHNLTLKISPFSLFNLKRNLIIIQK